MEEITEKMVKRAPARRRNTVAVVVGVELDHPVTCNDSFAAL